jgi:hypothetical protein
LDGYGTIISIESDCAKGTSPGQRLQRPDVQSALSTTQEPVNDSMNHARAVEASQDCGSGLTGLKNILEGNSYSYEYILPHEKPGLLLVAPSPSLRSDRVNQTMRCRMPPAQGISKSCPTLALSPSDLRQAAGTRYRYIRSAPTVLAYCNYCRT